MNRASDQTDSSYDVSMTENITPNQLRNKRGRLAAQTPTHIDLSQIDVDNYVHTNDIIPPPTPFRMSVTPFEGQGQNNGEANVKKTISSELKKEIELSLLHWPNNNQNSALDYSVRSLNRRCKNSSTLPQLSTGNECLSPPERSGRPLSWSYDMTESVEGKTISGSSNSQSNLSIKHIKQSRSVSSCTPTPASSYTTLDGSDSVLIDVNDSYDTLASEEFGDAVTALRTFDSKNKLYNRECRRMSQPPPIKLRSRLPSEDSIQSLQLSQVTRARRVRSKSEPARLVYDEIRQSFHKELAKLCPLVGDIASLDAQHHRKFTRPALTIADPLWHHVTNEPEELSFHVGDVLLVLDMSDKDWWWGRRTSSTNIWSPTENSDYEEAGWFPSTFVRLRANQAVTADELLEDIKQGTVDTASVVRHYNSSLLSRDQARCNVVNEIITAERDYVKHLKDIVEGFIQQSSQRTDMFTERQISLIFGNISEIYKVAQNFLDDLEAAVKQHESVHLALVGKCFLEHKSKFEIYSTYCNNHPRALEELQTLNQDSRYTHFFEACRLLQNMIELPLDGFLLTPIQKICKYPLQLGELLKYTSTEHEDHQYLQDALNAMKDIAMLINERKRKLESIQKIIEWQSTVDDWQGEDVANSSSELIHSGELSKLSSAGRLVDRNFFLFDHQLIQCKKELLKKSLIYKSRIPLDSHSIVSIEDGKVNNSSTYAKNAFEIRNADGECVLFLCAKSAEDKEKWLKFFDKEKDIVSMDKENGFSITESFKALAKVASTPKKTTKPNKTSHLRGRHGSDSKLTTPNIMDDHQKDKANNNKSLSKQKTGNGIIHKLKRARIVT